MGPSVPTKHEHEFLALVRENDGRLRHICRAYARDAKALFAWTEPQVPPGWHGVAKPLTGTVVFVHQ